MAKIYLTREDRSTIDSVLKNGLGQPAKPQWLVVRLALARSLQMQGIPGSEFARSDSQSGGSELHDAQVTGHGGSGHEDFRDVFAALLSIREGRDYISNPAELDSALNRHIRRGLKEIRTSWKPSFDFFDYLLQEMYFDRGGSGKESRESEGSRVKEQLGRVLGQLGIGSDIVDKIDGPRLTRFILELHQLDDFDRLRKGLSKIAFALGLGEDLVDFSRLPMERRVSLDIPRPTSSWSIMTWTQLVSSLASTAEEKMALPICIGTDVLGDAIVRDLTEAPHLFVAGTTGSGKSMCIHGILLSLIHRRSSRPELVLIDPKSVEFGGYAGLKVLRGGEPITDMDDANKILVDLVDEMEERQRKLSALEARNISEANDRGARLKRIVVVVDELADLFTTHPAAETLIIRLAQKARAVGIHLVLATQRPEAATFSGLLRSNIPSRIALTVQKSAESRIILDEAGAENLLMRGDMLVKFAGRSRIRAHGCLVQPADIANEVRMK